jgi:hypothetical protein
MRFVFLLWHLELLTLDPSFFAKNLASVTPLSQTTPPVPIASPLLTLPSPISSGAKPAICTCLIALL